MPKDTTYSYKGSDNFVIENGIISSIKKLNTKKHISYGDFVLERLRATPEFIGLVNGLNENEESFAEMTDKSVKCAMWLKQQKVNPGDVIGICTHIRMDVYVPCFASLYIGAVFNPWWNDGITRAMMKHSLTMTRPKILFADETSARLALEVAKEVDLPLKVVIFGNLPDFQSLDNILATQDTKNVPEFRCTKLSSLQDPAVILYTSGSTGLPKGALLSHISLFGNVESFRGPKNLDETIIALSFAPLAWVSAVLSMLKGAVVPEKRIIYPEFSEDIAFQLIEKFKVNWMFMGSSASVRIHKSPAISNYDLSSLKYLLIGGNVLKDVTQKALAISLPQTTIFQAYGTTELGGITVKQVGDQPKPGSCGEVALNITMKVIDTESGILLGPNQTGEVCFKSPFMMTNYYGNLEETHKAIDAEEWFHTGDLGHYDKEGDVYITDRIKEMIKYRGYQISPAMIEQVLLDHPEVSEAAVISVPNIMDDEHPMAFVVKTPNAKVSKKDLQELVAVKLPDYMKLRGGVEFLGELPRTPSGKLYKVDLRKIAQASEAH